jgi:hypothetical protein
MMIKLMANVMMTLMVIMIMIMMMMMMITEALRVFIHVSGICRCISDGNSM